MSNSRPYNWNAADYAAHSANQFALAQELIAKLDLRGDEVILDLGCGTGKATAELARRAPAGRVVGVDSAPSMITLAQQRFLPADQPNLTYQVMDARQLAFEDAFDIVFSNAVLHWVDDHPAVLRGIHRALRASGRILLQMGGRGNVASVLSALEILTARRQWRHAFRDFTFPYYFYTAEDYERWLPEAGFSPWRIEMLPRFMRLEGEAGLAGWFRTAWLPYLEPVPAGERERFIAELVEIYVNRHPPDDQGIIYAGLVRLEVEAGKKT